MTKRLLAIALVVMVAVSAMYLPSVLSVSAADTTKVADQAAYEALLKDYTVTIDGYNQQTVKLHPNDIATPEALVKAITAKNIIDIDKGVVSVLPVEGKTDFYNVKTGGLFDLTVQTAKVGTPATFETKTIYKVAEGTLVSDIIATIAKPADVANKIFIGWTTTGAASIDTNADGKIDAPGIITAQYAGLTVPSNANVNFLHGVLPTSDDTAKALLNGSYVGTAITPDGDSNKIANTGNPLAFFETKVATPDAIAAQTISVANIDAKSVTALSADYKAEYTFSHWTEKPAVLNVRQFQAVYKKVTTTNTYTFKNKDGVDFAPVISVTSDSVISGAAAYDLLTDSQKKDITNYLETINSDIKAWKLAASGSNAFNVTLDAAAIVPITYYFLNEAGVPSKTVVQTNTSTTSPLDYAPVVAKDLKFVKWNLAVGKTDTYNGTYDVADVVLPAAKNKDNSFAFAKTVSGKKAVYKKTLTPRLTAGKGTFNKTEVKLVNKEIAPTVKINPINCTAKKGTMTEKSGTPVTVTFNKKGTAYVVVSFAYNGTAYTKTMTKTVK